MGLQPLPPRRVPVGPDPRLWPAWYVADLRDRLRGRCSWFRSRRRRAYAAVLELIRWHEATLWPEPETPQDAGLVVGGAGCIVATVPALVVPVPGRPAEETADGHDWRDPIEEWHEPVWAGYARSSLIGAEIEAGTVAWNASLGLFIAVGREPPPPPKPVAPTRRPM